MAMGGRGSRRGTPLTLSGRELGGFGAAGGTMTFIEWDDSSKAALQQSLLDIAGYLENTRVPMIASREIAIKDTQEHFDSETDPNGESWAPLDPFYRAMKLAGGYPEDILHRTGDMETAATSDDAWIVTNDSLAFNANALPREPEKNTIYGLYHQAGSKNQMNVGIYGPWKRGVLAQKALGIPVTREDLKTPFMMGTGEALPKREFIGISEGAEFEIMEAFEEWFENGIEMWDDIPDTGGPTVVQVRVQNRIPKGQPGAGRFAPGFHTQ